MITFSPRILVLAPHVDDELNCAGLLVQAKLIDADILIAACSACEDAVPEGHSEDTIALEFSAACDLLGVDARLYRWPVREFTDHRQDLLQTFVELRDEYQPNVVICPASYDMHQDHTVVHEEALRAFRNVPLLLGWDSPNNSRVATTNFFAPITDMALEHKVAAWRLYTSQHFRSYFDADFIRSLAAVRGKQCRSSTGLAEAYEVLNVKLWA